MAWQQRIVMACLTVAVATGAWGSPEVPLADIGRIEPAQAPTIDGELDDPIWKTAPLIDALRQIRPSDGGTASERTEVRLLYSADTLYVALAAHDSEPAAVDARVLVQGQTFESDDRFEIHLDTFNDRRNAYRFAVNPNGIRADALLGSDYLIEDWDALWHAAARRQPWGWSAELAIPFRSLSFDPNAARWGLNLIRVIPRKGEHLAWSSRARRTSPAEAGQLSELNGLLQGRGWRIAPALVQRHASGGPNPGNSLDASLNAFFKPTPLSTAAVTVNTDFSATEADLAPLNLSRFSVFFPEKRDFFLQDAGLFEFGGLSENARPFFSRRIGLSPDGRPLQIEYGGKFTGRLADWSLGLLAVRQHDAEAGRPTDAWVTRLSRDVLQESNVGLIATGGDPRTGEHNRVLGWDVALRDSDWRGSDQALTLGAWWQRSEGVTGTDEAWGTRLDYPNDRFAWHIDLARIGERFDPALGFVNRDGVTTVDASWRHRHRFDAGPLQWLGTRVQGFRSQRLDGSLQTESIYWNVLEGVSQGNDFLTLFVGREREHLNEGFEIAPGIDVPVGEYSDHRRGLFLSTGPQRELASTLEFTQGDFLGGRSWTLAPAIIWRPNAHVLSALDLQHADVSLPTGRFVRRLSRLRLDLAFNARWAWLNLVQHDNQTRVVSLNSRLRWQPRADREFFLVLNRQQSPQPNRSSGLEVLLKASFELSY